MAMVSPVTFPKFPNLPLELRRQIWLQAVLEKPQQVFTIGLTDSSQSHQNPDAQPWQHMFPGLNCTNTPALLRTCREAREVALTQYQHGLHIEMTYWLRSWVWKPSAAKEVDCEHGAEVLRYGQNTYWNPESDIVYLSNEKERHTCPSNAICRLHGSTSYKFLFDKRAKFLVVTSDIWDLSENEHKLCFPGLEFLFVIKDMATVRRKWLDDGKPIDGTQMHVKKALLQLGSHFTNTLVREGSTAFGNDNKVSVRAVESIEDALSFVRTWQLMQESIGWSC
ncbi:hypothetical protein IFR05_003217 [Cadophora sp. M221]|nr:hypothetical protein IFR05_003217 [Cadophora sp. M221]